MSEADKMFEDLGYTKRSVEDWIVYTKDCEERFDTFYIYFFLDYGTCETTLDYGYSRIFNVKEHLAIHEKMKELGWIK